MFHVVTVYVDCGKVNPCILQVVHDVAVSIMFDLICFNGFWETIDDR
jgi:hypothetical protein